jgi:C-1 hydroxylase
MTKTQQNKKLFWSFVELWNTRNFDEMVELWSPEMVHHHRNADYGRDDVYALIGDFMSAFPDLVFDVQQVVAEGDYVTARMIARATHSGDFAGIPASGREIAVTVMGVVRIADGRIVEHWNIMDELHLMQQLGLVPDEFLEALAPT